MHLLLLLLLLLVEDDAIRGEAGCDGARQSGWTVDHIRDAPAARLALTELERLGHVVTRNHLQDAVYGGASAVESNTIAVFIHQLRRKLVDVLIAPCTGHGYVVGQPRP